MDDTLQPWLRSKCAKLKRDQLAVPARTGAGEIDMFVTNDSEFIARKIATVQRAVAEPMPPPPSPLSRWQGISFATSVARLPLPARALPLPELDEDERRRLQHRISVRWKARRIAERTGDACLRARVADAERTRDAAPESFAIAERGLSAGYALLVAAHRSSTAPLLARLMLRQSAALRLAESKLLADEGHVRERPEAAPCDVSPAELSTLLSESKSLRAAATAARLADDDEPAPVLPTDVQGAGSETPEARLDDPGGVAALAVAELARSRSLLASAQALLCSGDEGGE